MVMIQALRHADARSELSEGLPFQRLLRKRLFDKALQHLKAQTPSGVHLAIEELGPLANGDVDELRAGLEFFQHHMSKSHFADEVQAYLSLFLSAHGEEIAMAEDWLRSGSMLLFGGSL
ncbi:WDR36 [Symbiodinium microadriaticum]|nr:WDR36 [Symbiodinium microadriaticum]